MRKILSLILAFVFVAGICASAPITLTANAASVDDLTFELSKDEDFYWLIDCNDYVESNEIIIPSVYNGLPVQITYGAFSYCGVSSIIILEGITTIPSYAFEECYNLTSIYIPKSITTFGVEAFYNTYVNNVFYGGSIEDWENIYFENELGEEYDGYSIENIGERIHYNVTDVSAHYNKTIIKPSTCTEIGKMSLSCSCGYLYTEEIEMLEHNYVGDSCNVCGRIAWDYGYGSLYNYLGTSKEVVIPESIDGEKIDTIYGNCFAGNENIETITISESISYLNFSALSGIPNLKEINVSSESDYYKSVDGVLFDKNTEILLKYPENKPDATYDIPDGVKSISVDAFSGNKNLKSVNIPGSVRTIGERAFTGCESLSNIGFSDEVQVIGEAAFYGTSLKSVTIPSNVTEIRNFAFGYCWNSKSYEDEKVEGFTIYGGKGTVAEAYATENGFTFIEKVVHTHNHTSTITKQPTCTESGVKTFTCSCGDTYIETIKAKGHTTSVINAKSATCTVDGYTGDTYCSTCKITTVKGSVIKATGHKWNNGSVTTEPTCTTQGEKTYVCEVCYEAKSEIVPATGHKEVVIPAIAPTYTTVGKTEGKKCSVCGTITVAQKDVAKLTLATPVVIVKNSGTGVKVTWKTIDGAESYKVYRKTYSTKTKKYGSWKTCGTVTTTSYVDTKAKSGTKYIYTVKALNGDVKSGIKNSSSILYLAQPTVKIANASTGVKVKWNKITGATGYKVYRAEYANGKWTGWKSVKTIDKGSTVSWTDKSAKSGVKYKYTVKAVNGKTASTYKSSSSLLFLAQPKVAVKALSNGIKVAWVQSTGATSYKIYRSEYNTTTKKWSSWKGIKTVKSTSKSYTDKSAKKGVKYRYAVKAVNGKVASSYKASSSVKR